jgi:hypothetical protein
MSVDLFFTPRIKVVRRWNLPAIIFGEVNVKELPFYSNEKDMRVLEMEKYQWSYLAIYGKYMMKFILA